jgi:hypothetical protein
VAVVRLILGTSPVLDDVAFTLLALHDLVDAARRTVLTVVIKAMSELSLLAFTVALVDAWYGILWLVDLLLDSRYPAMRRPLCAGQLDRLHECRLDVDAADLDAVFFSSTRAVATQM